MYENASKLKIDSGTGYSFSGALIDLRSGDLNLNPEQFHGLYDEESIYEKYHVNFWVN